MMLDDWEDEADALPIFRPFTRDDVEEIKRKIFEKKLLQKKREAKKKKNIAVRIKFYQTFTLMYCKTF